MPRGDKSKYTNKQERKADHIAESYESRGVRLKPMRPRELIAEVERCLGKSWQWIG
jgi:hypothetical protein